MPLPKYLNKHLEVIFRGETFEYFLGQVTPVFAKELRRVTGQGPVELWNAWMKDVGWEPDVVATLLWAARLQTARRLNEPTMEQSLQMVEESISYDDLLGDGLVINFIGWDEDLDAAKIVAESEAKTEMEAVKDGGVDPEG